MKNQPTTNQGLPWRPLCFLLFFGGTPCSKIAHTIHKVQLPSGKHTKNYGTSPFCSWENSLFQWPFSIAMLVITRGYILLNPIKPP